MYNVQLIYLYRALLLVYTIFIRFDECSFILAFIEALFVNFCKNKTKYELIIVDNPRRIIIIAIY